MRYRGQLRFAFPIPGVQLTDVAEAWVLEASCTGLDLITSTAVSQYDPHSRSELGLSTSLIDHSTDPGTSMEPFPPEFDPSSIQTLSRDTACPQARRASAPSPPSPPSLPSVNCILFDAHHRFRTDAQNNLANSEKRGLARSDPCLTRARTLWSGVRPQTPRTSSAAKHSDNECRRLPRTLVKTRGSVNSRGRHTGRLSFRSECSECFGLKAMAPQASFHRNRTLAAYCGLPTIPEGWRPLCPG